MKKILKAFAALLVFVILLQLAFQALKWVILPLVAATVCSVILYRWAKRRNRIDA
jgi:hypothetical protein